MLTVVMWALFVLSFAVRAAAIGLPVGETKLTVSLVADVLFVVPVGYWLFTIVRGWKRRRKDRNGL